MEIELQESSSEEESEQALRGSLEWDKSGTLPEPLISTARPDFIQQATDDSILQRFGVESPLGSLESEEDCGQHYPQKSWSISVNRLDRIDVRDISPERRPMF